jgi:hypothetical protein
VKTGALVFIVILVDQLLDVYSFHEDETYPTCSPMTRQRHLDHAVLLRLSVWSYLSNCSSVSVSRQDISIGLLDAVAVRAVAR